MRMRSLNSRRALHSELYRSLWLVTTVEKDEITLPTIIFFSLLCASNIAEDPIVVNPTLSQRIVKSMLFYDALRSVLVEETTNPDAIPRL